MTTKEVKELMSLFKGSFINEINELILVPKTNLYFKLDNVKTRKDLIYKIIAWCSRDVAKSEPFDTERENRRYHEMLMSSFNYFLNVGWNIEIWWELYNRYGNGTNEEECRKMIENNF